jgi:hypothetical protein
MVILKTVLIFFLLSVPSYISSTFIYTARVCFSVSTMLKDFEVDYFLEDGEDGAWLKQRRVKYHCKEEVVGTCSL